MSSDGRNLSVDDVTVDASGRVIIKNKKLAKEMRKAATDQDQEVAAANVVAMCGCNTVPNCGGSLVA